MKALANLLLCVSVTLGALSAATAYVVSLDAPNEALAGLTLAADAGLVERPGEEREPIIRIRKGDRVKLDAAVLERLRAAEVDFVRVHEFRFALWRGRWLFLLSLVGLAIGSYLMRRANRHEITRGDRARVASPARILAELRKKVARLVDDVGRQSDQSSSLQLIVDRLSAVQRQEMLLFVDARPVLMGRLGATGYAELMSSFAAAERSLNRAWSAAADGAYHEAQESLLAGAGQLDETVGLLPAEPAG